MCGCNLRKTAIYTVFPTRRASDLEGEVRRERQAHLASGGAVAREEHDARHERGEHPDQHSHRRRAPRAPRLRRSQGGPDRKSTRLNSSHRSISYAVLVLKKKKQTA